MWLAEYDIDVYNAPEVFSVPPLTRLILPVMSGRTCPDISGYATSGIIWRSAWGNSGALWTEDTGNSLTKSYDYGPDPIVRIRMRAGAYDSTYGSSSSVSVAAAYVLMIIKA